MNGALLPLIHTPSYCGQEIYRVFQKDGLNFVRLYFLNSAWYVDDLHNI